MKERPILFSGAMVRALLAGTKTQTRRIVKPEPQMVTDRRTLPWEGDPAALMSLLETHGRRCPYGQPGDRLWVRETWFDAASALHSCVLYRATDDHKGNDVKWCPSIHMPRWASRITLEITGVRVERLQDISEADCWAEGIEEVMHDFDDVTQCEMANRLGCCIEDGKPLYAQLWESINGPGSWDANPWVWVLQFPRWKASA